MQPTLGNLSSDIVLYLQSLHLKNRFTASITLQRWPRFLHSSLAETSSCVKLQHVQQVMTVLTYIITYGVCNEQLAHTSWKYSMQVKNILYCMDNVDDADSGLEKTRDFSSRKKRTRVFWVLFQIFFFLAFLFIFGFFFFFFFYLGFFFFFFLCQPWMLQN